MEKVADPHHFTEDPDHDPNFPFRDHIRLCVAVQHHLDADPEPSSQFEADPDQTFHFEVDPDPTPDQSDANLRPLIDTHPRLHIEPPGLHCERLPSSEVHLAPMKLPNFDLITDPGSAFSL
jgi:hypothetical protein